MNTTSAVWLATSTVNIRYIGVYIITVYTVGYKLYSKPLANKENLECVLIITVFILFYVLHIKIIKRWEDEI